RRSISSAPVAERSTQAPGQSDEFHSRNLGATQYRILHCTNKNSLLFLHSIFEGQAADCADQVFGLPASITILAALWPSSWVLAVRVCIWRAIYSCSSRITSVASLA